MISLAILFFSIIFASAVCSMAEAAILSLPLVRARILFEQKRPNSKDVLYLKENINWTVASIVVINNAINIVGAIFVGQRVAHLYGDRWLAIVSTVLTLTIIIVSEIIPKIIGERFKIPISLLFAKPLRLLVWVFKPFINFLNHLINPFLQNSMPWVTEDEIKMMLKMGRDAGTVELDEEVLCNRVFRLNDLRAIQIMKPIGKMYALDADKTLEEVKELIVDAPYNRIGVFSKDLKNVVGIVQHRILLREIARDNYQAKVRDFMTPPIFVDQLTKGDTLLEKFQLYHQHLFIVQDNARQVIGLVTMEDVLEELFGEIYDEKDASHRMPR